MWGRELTRIKSPRGVAVGRAAKANNAPHLNPCFEIPPSL